MLKANTCRVVTKGWQMVTNDLTLNLPCLLGCTTKTGFKLRLWVIAGWLKSLYVLNMSIKSFTHYISVCELFWSYTHCFSGGRKRMLPLLQMLVVVVCRWGRFQSLTMPAHHPGKIETGREMRGALALYRSPFGKGWASLILFESAFCHVLYHSTNKTQVLD